MWCSLALWPVVRRRWLRNLLPLYPLVTLGATIATGNHRFIDLVGSLAEVAIVHGIAVALERALAVVARAMPDAVEPGELVA